MLFVMLFPLAWSVFCGLWKTRNTQTEIVADSVEIGAEYARAGLEQARRKGNKKTK